VFFFRNKVKKTDRKQLVTRADRILESGRSRRPRQGERAAELLRQIEDARHDKRRIPEAGRALETLQRGKLYKALGFATYEALLASIGMSRTKAFGWRKAAAEPDEERVVAGRERSSAGPSPHPLPEGEGSRGEAEGEARRIAGQLAAVGVRGRVFLVGEGDERVVRLEVRAEDARRITVA
jgi:hypothetical protein